MKIKYPDSAMINGEEVYLGDSVFIRYCKHKKDMNAISYKLEGELSAIIEYEDSYILVIDDVFTGKGRYNIQVEKPMAKVHCFNCGASYPANQFNKDYCSNCQILVY